MSGRTQGSAAGERSGFDKLARPYRWMEWLSFGPLLWRTRTEFLGQLRPATQALVLGDGDGRFTATLMQSQTSLRVAAVDVSGGMLQSLHRRVEGIGAADRLSVHHGDARSGMPSVVVDLVCTHFFLDCLTDAEVQQVAAEVRARMPRGQWLVSDFDVPPGMFRLPASVLVRFLYAAFRVLAGLRVSRLPDYRRALSDNGYDCIATRTRMFGLLRSELWQTR